MWRILAGPLALLFVINAQAQENVRLKAGAGQQTVESYCGACHSLDYPRINAPFLDRQGWDPPTPRSSSTIWRRITAAAAERIPDKRGRSRWLSGANERCQFIGC
jgi:mono/diheme cytochrome c family protein